MKPHSLAVLGLATLLGLAAASSARAQVSSPLPAPAQAAAAQGVATDTSGARTRPSTLAPRSLLQLALLQNADVMYARLQSRIADEGLQAETGLYDPIAYASFRRDGRSRERTTEERLATALSNSPTRLEEMGRSGEVGVRMRAPTGGEASVALRSNQRRSNVIASAPFSQSDSESAAALVLTLRQPLLRGLGRDVTETDLRVADAERDIGRWLFRQQVLRVASDALSAYWQLERALLTQALRDQALDNARALRDDVRLRIDGGRLPIAALDEADAALATRQAEVARGVQALADATTRVRQLLDLPPDDKGWQLAGAAAPPLPALDRPAVALAGERLPAALAAWPPLRMAQLRRTQADLRLALAVDRNRPSLDLQASYSTNSLTYGPVDAASKALQGRNPDWNIGLSLEMPFGGDKRAGAQQRAQTLRRQQADLEIHSVRQSLANDLFNRVAQLTAVRDEQRQLQQDRDARQALLAADQAQFDVGVAPLNRLLRRQSDLLEAQMRVADADARLALAQVALQLVDGSLLAAYDVRIEE